MPTDATLPRTLRRPVTDTNHGTRVTDDYQWLEDRHDPEVRAWSDAQNAFARSRLDALPWLPALRDRVTGLLGASIRYQPLRWRAGRLFAYKYQPPLQRVMLVEIRDLDDLSTERVVVDPSAIDSSGSTAIDWAVPSPDGGLVAVSLSRGGSEDGSLHVFDLETGQETGDVIPRVQYGTAGGSAVWLADGRTILYTRYPAPGERPDEDLHSRTTRGRWRLGSRPRPRPTGPCCCGPATRRATGWARRSRRRSRSARTSSASCSGSWELTSGRPGRVLPEGSAPQGPARIGSAEPLTSAAFAA